MTGSPSFAHIKSDVLAVIASVPRGKVTTFTAIAQCLGVMQRHVATIVAGLDVQELDGVPWHRVVADGGAVGRHQRRDAQIRLLRADGLAVSPVGFVGGLENAMLTKLTKPRPGVRADVSEAEPEAASGQSVTKSEAGPTSRSRGRFDRPGTKLQ